MSAQQIGEQRQMPLGVFPEQSELSAEEIKAMRGIIYLQQVAPKLEEEVVLIVDEKPATEIVVNKDVVIKKQEPTDWIGKKAKKTATK